MRRMQDAPPAPAPRVNRPDDDPRLHEVAELSRFETRAQITMWLCGGLFCGIFALIGFIPGPVNDYVEYLCLRLTGHIDSRTIGWSAGIFMFALTMLIALGIAALPKRKQPSVTEVRFDRLTSLRKQMRAEGYTFGQMGYWTATNWQRFFRWMGVTCLIIATIAVTFVWSADYWLHQETRPLRILNLAAGEQPGEGPVRISAVARLDFAFRVSTRHYGAVMLSGDETTIYRLDDFGFRAVRTSAYHDTLYVPLTAPDWRPGQPIAVFYQCEFSCAVDVAKGAPRVPTPVIVSGLLHRSALPLFVKRTFKAAGIMPASSYAVLPDREMDPKQPFAIIALIGFITAMLFLVMPPYYRWSTQRQARKREAKSQAARTRNRTE